MYLGIDLGTSAVKVILTNDNSEVLAQASSNLETQRPFTLWSEQRPDDWFIATQDCLDQLSKSHSKLLKQAQAIGLSGQMHGATLLDKHFKPLRSAILWNDGRCANECLELEQAVPSSRQIAGNIAMPGLTAPKLLWVKNHEPQIFEQIAHILLPKDYLRFLLTGELASDMSDSAGTLWMNVERRNWSSEMLEGTHLNPTQMPTLFEGPEITGTLKKELALRWGTGELPVVAGAGDNAAGALGAGVVTPGDAFLSLGTSGVYFLANERYAPNADEALHTFCHCLPNTWHQMTVSLSAASCLDWLARLTGSASVPQLLKELEAKIGSQGILTQDVPTFLPYLSGERTPHNNPNAQGVFFGMTHNTERAHLTQAVLEGVAFSFADGQKALLATGEPIKQVSVIGGGSRSQLWGRILSNTLNQSLLFHEGAEVGPALGASRLAQLGVLGDVSSSAIHDVCFKTPINHELTPDIRFSERYQDKWQLYRKLYKQSADLMGQ